MQSEAGWDTWPELLKASQAPLPVLVEDEDEDDGEALELPALPVYVLEADGPEDDTLSELELGQGCARACMVPGEALLSRHRRSGLVRWLWWVIEW